MGCSPHPSLGESNRAAGYINGGATRESGGRTRWSGFVSAADLNVKEDRFFGETNFGKTGVGVLF